MDRIKETLLPEIAHRSRQLDKEKRLDSRLQSLECEGYIRDYFAAYRAWNRSTYNKTCSDMWNYRKHTAENLKEIDVHHNQVEKVLNSQDPCKGIQKLTEELIVRASSPTDTG